MINFVARFPGLTGLTLNAQLYDATGATVGSAITSGFVALATPWNDTYTLLTTIPAGQVGALIFYDSADHTTFYTFSINPTEMEASALDVWKALTSALTTSGSVGKLIADNLNATLSSVFSRIGAPVGASISADIALVQADTDDLQTRIPAALVSGKIDASVGALGTGAIVAATFATDSITAAALAADAVSEIVTGVVAAGAPTVAAIDSQLSATHGAGAWATAAGFATPANVWTNTIRTLTSPTPGSTTPPAIGGGALSMIQAVSFDVPITGMVIPSNWSKIYFTAKTNTSVADSLSIIQIVVTSGGSGGDGLLYINGAVATGALAQGSLVIDQAGGNATISITDNETSLVTAGVYVYDLKVVTAASKSAVLASGTLSVGTTPTLAIV